MEVLPAMVVSTGAKLPRVNVAVVGAGTAGLMTAWLLEGSVRLTCFETDGAAGGNGKSSLLDVDGTVVETSLRPEILVPSDQPLTMTMLRLLGVPTVKAPARLVVLDESDAVTFQTSIQPLPSPLRRSAPASPALASDWRYLLKSLRRLRTSGAYELIWRDFVTGLSLSSEFVRTVATPVAASLLGIDYETMERVSATMALESLVRSLPTLRQGYSAPRIVERGVGRWLEQLEASLQSTRIRYRVSVSEVAPFGDRVVVTHSGGEEEFDAVVLAIPPWLAGEIIGGVRGSLLREVESTESQVALTQRSLSPPTDPWSTPSTFVIRDEASARLETRVASNPASDLWRSWSVPESSIRGVALLVEQRRHLLPTPVGLQALSRLGELQGENGIYLVGGASTGWECEEAALVSAVAVAYDLAPKSARLSRLLGAMAAKRGTRASVEPLP
ncbi:MAG: FAD-dependent oxidoreductase [Acidimicrobiales bacterium]